MDPLRHLIADGDTDRRGRGRGRGLRQAVVVDVLTGPARVTVRIGNSGQTLDEPLRYLDSYTPTPGGGDTVWLAPVGDTWLVIGAVAV